MWLFPDWFKSQWWNDVDGNYCTPDEIRSALDYSLSFRGNDKQTDDQSRMLISKKVSLGHAKDVIYIYLNRMFHNG